MIQGLRVLGCIPARGGSKGIPGKNGRILGNQPLLQYTITAACKSQYVDDVVLTTDCPELATLGETCGARVPFLRPAALASDTAKTIDAVVHMLDTLQEQGESYDILVLLQPTSPFRTALHIDEALRQFIAQGGTGGLVSVRPSEESPVLMRTLEDGVVSPILSEQSTVRRQDLPTYYVVNGAIYINYTSEITPTHSFNDNRLGYIMDSESSIDIDTMEDWERAELLLATKMMGE